MSVQPREFRVIALVNRTRSKAEALAGAIQHHTGARPAVYEDYHQMLAAERPDAVSLALPPDLNPEVSQAALAAGSHVIAEKPIAASLDGGTRMLPWAARYGRVLMIAENYRYATGYRRAAELIGQGAIGKPAVARWSLYARLGPDNPYYNTAWRQHPIHPGGYLSDTGVHHAAALRLLLGEADTVVAQLASVRPDLPPADTLSAAVRFSGGALASYSATYAMGGPESPLQVTGPQGALLVTCDRVELWRKGQPSQVWEEHSGEDGMVAMYQDFANAIRTGRPPCSTPAEGLADLQLIVAMLRSAETGHAVKVAEITSPT